VARRKQFSPWQAQYRLWMFGMVLAAVLILMAALTMFVTPQASVFDTSIEVLHTSVKITNSTAGMGLAAMGMCVVVVVAAVSRRIR
jgi:hypothetical protein